MLKDPIEGDPPTWHPDFSGTKVLIVFFNAQTLSAERLAEVDSSKRKKRQNKKDSNQVGVNEHNRKKVVGTVLKNHEPFFINIGNYRAISVQIRQLLAHFRPVKFWSRDRTPANSVCKKHS